MAANPASIRPRVVVGVDGSPTADAAIRWAHDYAGTIGATLEFVGVWQPIAESYRWEALAETWAEAKERAADSLPRTVQTALGALTVRDASYTFVEGHPARKLVDAASGAACLVVGNRGYGGFAGAVLGSVSSACVAHAPCPVVVVHEGDR